MTAATRRLATITMNDTTPLFFYGTGKKYGEFSQWYHAKFSVLKGEIYSAVGLPTSKLERPDDPVNFMTAEQCMMYCKAMRFGDLGTADKILLTPEPRKQKALGRQVKGFTEAEWDAVKFEVVQLANVAKFSQNEELRAVLLGTGDRELVEAATNDHIWGIGMDEKQGRATMHTRENWGHNLLGKALVGARVRILIDDDQLCHQCLNIDFEELLNRKLDGRHSSFVMNLGQLSALKTSSCDLCRSFASLAPCSPSATWKFDPRALSLFTDDYFHLRIFSGSKVFTGKAGRRNMGETNVLGVAPSKSSPQTLHSLTLAAMMDACDQIGFLGPEIPKSIESVCKIRLVNPKAFDFTLAKKWISYCRDNHKTRCSATTFSELQYFRVLDCYSGLVVKAPLKCRYVALSYVWGKTNTTTSSATQASPGANGSRFEKVIEDSITVTQMLGIRYLWVDRICIDHSNHADTLHQIRQMDLIYANSEITIIAAACETPDEGLPGINDTSRADQQVLELKNINLISTLPSGRSSIEKSRWYTRGWTFQEGILSTKRLIFTETQVIFDCNGMHCSEGLDMPLDNLHVSDKSKFDTYAYDLGPLERKAPQSDPEDYMGFVRSFSTKQLTYSYDTLNAFQGILSAFKRAQAPIYHFWGIPLFTSDESLMGTIHQEISMKSISARFVLALFWRDYRLPFSEECTPNLSWGRVESPPSWSWAGWNGEISQYFASTGKPCFSDAKVWLKARDGRLVNLDDIDFRKMNAMEGDYHSIFQLEAWTMPVEVKHLEVLQPKRSRRVVGHETKYAYFVTFDTGSQVTVCSELIGNSWHGTASPATFMALLPRSYTDDQIKTSDETAMVLQKVDGHYERVGLFRVESGWILDGKGRAKRSRNRPQAGRGWSVTLKRFWLG
ncbi:unnamed protein product [Clonostachys byssicola]|uniref:Heterokaryon incompatibility domain-containing protein n=1 Tax=Clonostachys byssicola TaxID=160290 RepID=A0A9N9U961_9HYPO|nr:unnamed protein product [Clonostachys byssicola]